MNTSRPESPSAAPPAAAAASLAPRRRRETARAVVQRLHAIPAQLFRASAPDDNADDEDGEPIWSKESFSSSSVTRSSVPLITAKGELGPNSVCLLTTGAPTTPLPGPLAGPLSAATGVVPLRHFAYEVAAAHALRGGRVLFVCAPATASFSLSTFTLQVEQQWVMQAARKPQGSSVGSPHGDDTHGRGVPDNSSASSDCVLWARQQAVLAAVERVEVLACASMADVYAVCNTYTFPTNPASELNDTKTSLSSGAPGMSSSNNNKKETESSCCEAEQIQHTIPNSSDRVAEVVPLCIVDGLTGPTSATTLQERATGQLFPIPHYLLCLLQRRLQCALLIMELPTSIASVAADSRFTAAPSLYSSSHGQAAQRTLPPSEESVLADSDIVSRLRVPHEHAVPRASLRLSAGTSSPTTIKGEGAPADFGRLLTGGGIGKAARVESGRAEATRWPQAPVSLLDLHFSVLYVEVERVARGDDRGSGGVASRTASAVAASPFGALLSASWLSLRYRLHLMSTSLSDAPGSARGSLRMRMPVEAEEVRGGGGSRGSASWSARSSRRPSAALAPTYTGTWVHSSVWRELSS